MNEREHFERLNQYFEKSRIGYNLALGGSKHFGFYPKDKRASEKEAQILMQELVAKKLKLASKDFVLDASCGQGVVSTFLAKMHGCRIYGITVIPFEIREANLLAKRLGVSDKVNYSLMDYNKMKFSNYYFDCIYTTESLSHSIDVRKTLKEFFRVMKKDGRIALFEYTLAEDKEFSKSEMRILKGVMKSSAMDGLKDFRHDRFQDVISDAGFIDVNVDDISENTKPSLARLRRVAIVPYYLFVKPTGLHKRFPNISAAVEFYKMAKKGLIRYNIFTATK